MRTINFKHYQDNTEAKKAKKASKDFRAMRKHGGKRQSFDEING